MKQIKNLTHWVTQQFSLKFLVVLGIVIIIKLFFSALQPFKIDMDAWISWGNRVLEVGPSQFYNTSAWTAYLPGYLYFLWIVAFIQIIIFPEVSQSGLEFLYKFFPILFDLANGILIYLIIIHLQKKHLDRAREYVAIIVSTVYLLLPFTTFNGSIWGQADSVHTFFMLLSFYVLSRNRIYSSAILFSIAVCIKPQALFMAPAYILYAFNHFSIVKNIILILTFLASGVLIVYPFYGINIVPGIQAVLEANNSAYGYNSLNTFNFWGIYGFWIPDSTQFMYGYSMKQVGIFLGGMFTLIGLLYYFYFVHIRKLKYTFPIGSLFAAYFVFTVVMFITQMHERYMYPFFAFLAVFWGYFWTSVGDRYKYFQTALSVYFVLLGFLHAVNLYYVYLYYMYFQIGVPAENTFYYFVSNNIHFWSYCMIAFYTLFVIGMPVFLRKMLHYEKNS